MLRIWPQSFNTEGFFVAVLKKNARTKEPKHLETAQRYVKPIRRVDQKQYLKRLEGQFGTPFCNPEEEMLLEGKKQVLITSSAAYYFPLPIAEYSMGLPFCKATEDGRVRPVTECITLRGKQATQQTITLNDQQLQQLLGGKDIPCDPLLNGDHILLWNDIAIGWSLAKEGTLKNRLSRWIVEHRSS